VSYESLKEIIKLQNLIDEKIMHSPEHLYQLKNEISDLKTELSTLTKTLKIAFFILSILQIILIMQFLKK
jgi:predicted DNA-binding ArsR family transcriptional regulator